MEHYVVIIVLLAIAIGLSSVSERIKVPYPVLLMATGIGVGFIPGFHFVPIDPEVVFLLFLPPILYEAAFSIPIKEFRANFRTISMMAIMLVFTTMIAIAVVVRLCIPDISWPVAFVIGAILSPPDAVAASGITKSLKLSSRTSTILEGESLINDASALIAYKVAVAVAVGATFSFSDATTGFLNAFFGGCLIGFIMAHVATFVQQKLRIVDTALMSFNLLLPFVAYMVAEEFGVSGVLAVVVMGLIRANGVVKRDKVSKKTQIEFRSMWATITFILSGLIFLLIGLEFPQVLSSIPSRAVIPLIMSAFAIFFIALVIRVLAVFRHKMSLDRVIRQVNHPNSARPTSQRRQRRIGQMQQLEPLHWKEALIIGWSGMRGIVSLATALALPLIMSSGEKFPHRDSIIFLTATVVILMLLIQGLGLPLLIRWLKVGPQK